MLIHLQETEYRLFETKPNYIQPDIATVKIYASLMFDAKRTGVVASERITRLKSSKCNVKHLDNQENHGLSVRQLHVTTSSVRTSRVSVPQWYCDY